MFNFFLYSTLYIIISSNIKNKTFKKDKKDKIFKKEKLFNIFKQKYIIIFYYLRFSDSTLIKSTPS